MPEDDFIFGLPKSIENLRLIGSEYEKDSTVRIEYWRNYFKKLGADAILEYNLKREEFIEIIQNLSFLAFGNYIGLLRLTNLRNFQVIHFINYRLKYKESKRDLRLSIEVAEKIKEFLEYDYFFNLIERRELEKENLLEFRGDAHLKQILQMIYPELAFNECKELEEKLIQIFFVGYRDIIENEFNLTFIQIVSCVAFVDYYLYSFSKFLENKRRNIKNNNDIQKLIENSSSIYIISLNELTTYYNNLKISNPVLNESIIRNVIKKLSCNLGTQYKDYESIIDNSIFSKYLYILDNESNTIIYPVFLNTWEKLRGVFKEVIKKADKWKEFNYKFSKTFERFIDPIIETTFGVKCYGDVWLDKTHQVDQLFIYQKYLFLVECTKREISLSSFRGGLPRLERDIKSIIKKNYSQLTERKQYIENNGQVDIYNSNKANRKRLFSIRNSDFNKIICLSVSYDDFTFILSQKIFHNLIKLDISNKNIISINFKDLIILSELFENPTFIIHYLMSRNRFLMELHDISLVFEEKDLIGIYNKGYLNQNKDFSSDPIFFSDHSRDIHDFITLRSEDRNEMRHLVEPFYFKFSEIMKLISLIISFDNPNSLEFSLSILSCEKKTIEDLNRFLIEASNHLEKVNDAKPQRFFIQSPIFKETLIFILTKERPDNNNIENYWSIIPKKLKGASTWISFVSNFSYSSYHLIKGDFSSDIKYY